ncbi:hypothetical protein SNEBB_002066 [Seison nebaliae]|nr:hypothetical protein SNEBB_002066 [Seison nebaliae]
MGFYRTYQVARAQCSRIYKSIRRYGTLKTHRIILRRKDIYDKSILLICDFGVLLIALSLVLTLTFEISYHMKSIHESEIEEIIKIDTKEITTTEVPMPIVTVSTPKPITTDQSHIYEAIVGRRLPFLTNECADKRFPSYHTSCKNVSSNFMEITELSNDIRKQIVYYHNKIRRTVRASNMKRMYYDLNLEQTAERHAALCQFEKDRHEERKEPLYYGFTGQNVGVNIPKQENDILYKLKGFVIESLDYYYGSDSYKYVSSYTQMIYYDSDRVGCGAALCKDGAVFVTCNYHTLQDDIRFPYKMGSSCSDCPRNCNCWNDLCDCGRPIG